MSDLSPGYRLHVVGRNVYVTDAMKSYAVEKLSKLDRFHHQIIDIHVTMDIQKLQHQVSIVLLCGHLKIKVSAISSDMYASTDKAISKLQSQIRRWKDRITHHHNKHLSIVDMQINVLQRPFSDVDAINEQIEEENLKTEATTYSTPKVIGSESKPLKTLTTDEAVMKLDLSGDHFLLFRGEEDRKLKVLYRRSDGNFGVLLPE